MYVRSIAQNPKNTAGDTIQGRVGVFDRSVRKSVVACGDMGHLVWLWSIRADNWDISGVFLFLVTDRAYVHWLRRSSSRGDSETTMGSGLLIELLRLIILLWFRGATTLAEPEDDSLLLFVFVVIVGVVMLIMGINFLIAQSKQSTYE